MACNVVLTGNIGSGKTTVCRIFEILEIPIYYSDDKAKFFLTQDFIKTKLRSQFGDAVFDENGRVDFKALSELVFNDKMSLDFLNKLIHPLVIEDYFKWLKTTGNAPFSIMESAIVFEHNLSHLFERSIYVYCPEPKRIERLIARDKSIREVVSKRVEAQLPDDEKIKRSDFVINNFGTHALLPQVFKIYNTLSPSKI